MRLTRPRLRAHLGALALILWAVAIFDAWTPTWHLRTGQIKGTDFLHFYTLARLGANGEARFFTDGERLTALQLAARPESVNYGYPPAYGPQVALLLAPLGYLSYGQALIVWMLVTATVYLVIVALLRHECAILEGEPRLVWLAALGFPPFWMLILHGQLSVMALALFVAAAFAAERARPMLSGACIGLLIYKPSLFVPALAVLALAGEWTMMGMAVGAGALEVLVACLIAGPGALSRYGDLLRSSGQLAVLLRAHPSQMHSWRAFWLLLFPQSPTIANSLYGVTSVVTIGVASWIWRRSDNTRLRLSAWLLAVVLASPHLYAYDLVILTPAWIWLVEWFLADDQVPAWVGRLLYLGYAAPLIAIVATVVPIQVSTLCYISLMVGIARMCRTTAVKGKAYCDTLSAADTSMPVTTSVMS